MLAGNWLIADGLNIPFHPAANEISVFMMAVVGACLGFLWYNCYPAKVFMGDTGSLALGGAFGMAAVSARRRKSSSSSSAASSLWKLHP